MIRSIQITFILALLHGFHLYGQEDTLNLDVFRVEARAIKLVPGFGTLTIDSAHMAFSDGESIANLLSQASPSGVKYYGPGQLSTSAIRGGSAQHTQVSLNGFRINQAMLGQSDLSMLPADLVSSVALHSGAGTLVQSSGSFGGLITLNTKPDTSIQQQVSTKYEKGSFGYQKTLFRLFEKGEDAFFRTTFYFDEADNNYPYVIPSIEEQEEARRKRADYKTGGWLQEIGLKTGKRSEINLLLWNQQNRRSLARPVHLTQDSGQQQNNDLFKILINGERYGTTSTFGWRSGYQYEFMQYNDELYSINSRHTSHNYQAGMEYRKVHRGAEVLVGGDYEYQKAISSEYNSDAERSIFSIFASGDIKIGSRWILFTVLRHEITEKQGSSFMPSGGASLFLGKSKRQILKLMFLKNHRTPSLNDLYWMPGGNPELNPEDGFSGEFGYEAEIILSKRAHLEMKLDIYHQKIQNRITWLPNSSGLWTPQNISEVTMQGFESRSELKWKSGALQTSVSIGYQYTEAINTEANSNRKQLSYIPKHTISNRILLSFKKVSMIIEQTYSGIRYIDFENNDWLDPYHIINIKLAGDFEFNKKEKLRIYLYVYNITDTKYESIVWYPMPGISFRAGIHLMLNKTKKQK